MQFTYTKLCIILSTLFQKQHLSVIYSVKEKFIQYVPINFYKKRIRLTDSFQRRQSDLNR